MKLNFAFLFYCILLLNNFISGQTFTKTLLRFPDTGQNTGFTKTFGEDNDYKINVPGFVFYSDSILTDTITGLHWQRFDGGEMTYAQAKIYIKNLSLGSFTDWRLPNALEAFSILNLQYVNPALDNTFFTKNLAEYWWTSEVQLGDTTKVWVTNSGGGIGNHPINETISAGGKKYFHVRAVRNPNTPQQFSKRYENNSGFIKDNATQLFWMSKPISDSMTWEQALMYIDSLNNQNNTNWRMPNIKELQSLANYNYSNPAIPNNIFSYSNNAFFWSSTTTINQPLRAWYLDSKFGITTYADKTRKLMLWLVSSDTKQNTSVENINTSQFYLYPNPTSDFICIPEKYLGVTAQLFSSYGQLIKEIVLEKKTDISDLPNANYFILIPDEKKQYFHFLKINP